MPRRHDIPNYRTIELLMRVRPAQLADILKAILRIPRAEILAATGCRYWIDPVSVFGAHLIGEGTYEEGLTHLLGSLLRAGDVFVDLGANEGYFSVLAGTFVGAGMVYAIEPQSRLQAVLRRNLELNRLANVVIERLVIADRVGELDLLLRPSTNTGASSLFRHWRIGSIREQVRSTTLDAFFAERGLSAVRMMKVDCEGAESLVFRGADDVLRRQLIEYMALEYHPGIIGVDACRDIHRHICGHRYRLATLKGLNVYCALNATVPDGAILRPEDYLPC